MSRFRVATGMSLLQVSLILVLLACVGYAAWDVAKPAGTDSVSTVDDTIRADKQTLLTAIGAEHDFSASTTTGVHAEGSARCWVDVAANRTSRDSSEGRLFVETDTSKLYYGNSESAWVQFTPRRNIERTSYIQEDTVTCTSVSWQDVGGDNTKTTIATTGGSLMIWVTFTAKNNVASYPSFYTLSVDGIAVTDSTYGLAQLPYESGNAHTMTIARLVLDGDGVGDGVDLSAGSHDVELQWRVSDASGQAQLKNDITLTLTVEEV